MDTPEPQFNPQPERETTELDDRYDSLQYLVNSMLGLLTLLAAVLAAFLMRVERDKGFELNNFSIQATNFIAQFHRGPEKPQDEFLHKITDYGRTHADFLPILTRYGLLPGNSSTSVVPAAATPVSPSPVIPKK